MKKRNGIKLLLCVLALLIPITAAAHSGRTDSSGGHRDNKNKSGLGYYHYHCGGNPPHLHTNGVCPYKSGSASGASSGTKKSTATVSAPKKVYATRVDAVSVPNSLAAGKSVKLEGKVYPENAEDKEVSWSTKSPEIVSVTESGTLVALKPGTAIVLAKTERGTTGKFTVTVTEVQATSIQITDKPSSITLKDEVQLAVDFTPENTTDKAVIWNTADPNVATVTESGKLVAKGVGKTVISVAHAALMDSFEVEVLPIKAARIEIRLPEAEGNITDITTVGKNIISCKMKQRIAVKLYADVFPPDTTDKTVTWSVDDSGIAKIDEDGTLLALRNGTVTVRAETKDGRSDQIEIEVYSEEGGIIGGAMVAGAGALGAALLIRKRKKSSR